jgi:hypothetical protein
MPTSVSRLAFLLKSSGYMLFIVRHTTADNSQASEPKSQNVRTSEGGTHTGPSVVACFLEKRKLIVFLF